MKIAIIQFPGSNCERETILAVKRNGMDALPFLWNDDPAKLKECVGYIIIGGFSYEDRGRAGIIAALDPIMPHIIKESTSGKPLLGICNGAQILVESGLVPGTATNQLLMALAVNKREKNQHILGTGYYNDFIYLTAVKSYPQNAFLRNLSPKQLLRIPIANGEGRFVLADKLWEKILAANIGFLQYCDEYGIIKNEFPANPNGSQHNLAALCNATGNVMAIMPHPERTRAGDSIFSSMRDYILEGFRPQEVLDFTAAETELAPYILSENNRELIIQLIINDNTAVSIQQTLHNLQFSDVQIKRYSHWEITFTENLAAGEITKIQQAINESCELFNPNKEIIGKNLYASAQDTSKVAPKHNCALLVQDKENIIGQHKLEVLRETFKIKGINAIKFGNLWVITTKTAPSLAKVQKFILQKHVLFNPFSQDGFYYKN